MKGITFAQVKECIQYLADQIPATEEVCAEYTLNTAPGWVEEARKGRDRVEHPDMFVLHAKVGKVKIDLRVEGIAFVSETDEQLEKGCER